MSAGQTTDLHSELSFVEAHQHVDDVKARGGFVLLVNSSEQCTKSLHRETGGHCVLLMSLSKAIVTFSECQPVTECRVYKRPKNADELKATVKETWAFIPPQTDHLHATSN